MSNDKVSSLREKAKLMLEKAAEIERKQFEELGRFTAQFFAGRGDVDIPKFRAEISKYIGGRNK